MVKSANRLHSWACLFFLINKVDRRGNDQQLKKVKGKNEEEMGFQKQHWEWDEKKLTFYLNEFCTEISKDV